MGYAVYNIGHDRFGGYGVPSYCEHPDCNEEIDRGISYACGGEPFSEHGCDLYFCGKHRSNYIGFNGFGNRCRHRNDCDCEYVELCDRCAKGKESFKYKPEHPDWMKHVIKDASWKKWRSENKELVDEYKKLLKKV